MNTFTNKIVEERQIKKPKLVLGADGSTSKCIVAGMILEADEALHYSLDGFEEMKKLKVKRKLGTDGHLKKALTSHINYNSLRVGSPNRVMTLRKNKQTQSPLLN